MSVSRTQLSSLSLDQSHGDPGHGGLLMGTPADISPRVAPQTLAIELEPFDSRMSEMMRMV